MIFYELYNKLISLMPHSKSIKKKTFLGTSFENGENSILLTNSYTLRKVVGIMGMALPFLLFIFLYIFTGFVHPLDSISHYYFTRASGIFVATISILAIFLIIYKGKEPVDLIVSLTAGLAAFLVILFPTSNISNICCDSLNPYSVTVIERNNFRVIFHYISAGVFLGCLSYMSLFIFTKSDKPISSRNIHKIYRNRIYRTCGISMIIAILVMFIGGYFKAIPPLIYDAHHITYWMETIAIEAFGFAWLVKGNTLFKDKI